MRWLWIALLIVVDSWPVSAVAGTWIHLRTPEFEFYSTNPERESRELIRLLDNVQSFMGTVSFLRVSPSQNRPRTPVRIVALSSRDEYSPFRLSQNAFGYFRPTPQYNYIVLQDIKPEHRQAAIHEYIHLLVRQANLALPLWLNEGVADFYSSFDHDGVQAQVGGLLSSRMRVLQRQSLLDLNTLFAVDHKSSSYNNAKDIAIFYAQSWALVHMLSMSPEYGPGFSELIRSMSQGASPAIAFFQAYGRSIPDIESDLRAYVPALSPSSVVPRFISTIVPTHPVSCSLEEVQSDFLLDQDVRH